jgi:glutathione S-transferase
MKPRLYVIPASPPCACIEAVLQAKGVEYDVTELPNVLHVPHQLVRFGRSTVPAIRLGAEKVVGSREITRRIDELWPDPPMYGRPEVEVAERFGDEDLQPIGRRMAAWTTTRRPSAVPSFFADSSLPLPDPVIRVIAPVVTRLGKVRNGASDDAVEADLRALPHMLARVDGWLDAGVVGGGFPNAADFQIASVVRLLLVSEDLVPVIERHSRVAELARRLFPRWPGRVPAGVVPAAWLP